MIFLKIYLRHQKPKITTGFYLFPSTLDLVRERLRLERITGVTLANPSLPKHGHLELVAQDHFQTAFEYLEGGRLYNHLHSLFPWLFLYFFPQCLEVQQTFPSCDPHAAQGGPILCLRGWIGHAVIQGGEASRDIGHSPCFFT